MTTVTNNPKDYSNLRSLIGKRRQLILYTTSLRKYGVRGLRPPAFLRYSESLDRNNWEAATTAANTIVFRVSGEEDGKTLAKCFDTSPQKEVIGEVPIYSPVSDVISHLVRLGHSDARVTRFAQIYLENVENVVSKPPRVGLEGPPANMRSDYRW